MTGLSFELLCMQLLTGIALGSIYALLALGLCLIFGMLNVVNFAHGAFFMVGAFLERIVQPAAGAGHRMAVGAYAVLWQELVRCLGAFATGVAAGGDRIFLVVATWPSRPAGCVAR